MCLHGLLQVQLNLLTRLLLSATSFSSYKCPGSQIIPRTLRNQEVHYRVHKSSTLVPILTQINSVHNLLPCSFKIHFNIILQPIPMPLHFYFLWLPWALHISPISPSLIWSNIWRGVQIMKFLIMQLSPASSLPLRSIYVASHQFYNSTSPVNT
jgi:hypothetical protein